jgi:hypothetical protein
MLSLALLIGGGGKHPWAAYVEGNRELVVSLSGVSQSWVVGR